MTRVNAGIPVERLSDQHLIAEHREIKRIPRSKFTSKIPEQFTLGKGHVLFFSDKNLYTSLRYDALYEECKCRGFNVTYFGDNWPNYKGDYNPSKEDTRKVVERITERVLASKEMPRYYGKEIAKEEYINMLNELL